MSLPEAASQSFAVLSALAVRIQAPSGLNAARETLLMGEGDDELARGRIPEFAGFVPARGQDASTVRTKRRIVDRTFMRKGGDELARGCIPEFGGVVRDSGPAGRAGRCAVRAKGHVQLSRHLTNILIVLGR